MLTEVEHYRNLHRIPELSGQEEKTSLYIENALREMGYQPKRYGKTGIVTDLVVDESFPWILLRADMDALPITENSCAVCPSEHPGVMHACGHDTHMAMLLGAAQELLGVRPSRNIRFLFQPAEEKTAGAMEMIAMGAMPADLRACFAVHVWPGVPKGQLATRSGALMASSDRMRITVTGRSAHCGQQHLGADALRTAADIVDQLPGIKAVAKDTRTVLFCGSLHSGSAHNIVADNAVMTGTLRTFSEEDRALIKEALSEELRRISQKYGTEVCLDWEASNPSLDNSGELIDILKTLIEDINSDIPASLTAEDFSRYQRIAPGVLLWLGTGDTSPLHTPSFCVPEEILQTGVDFWVKVATYPW